ncbi:parallel beta helix pectate lyase-like protein [Aminobacter aminovorans]|uniref:Nitrous oxide reductase family maturation protein NosD n=1 Tax=Aminobacter aminovorans TaxID=83263 RepID=A0A380WK34_AMIAI|nr:right-handed parallel beta-helix repeat-containing protein [Aminobacter aminovorans]TCS19096.1 parallel beta helix pectate lyase-like protein [Aminobacter aminovorans]SUU89128.1 nitrous oxide reductase family maturation protein NosD [Aminobacter aminovorans]
MSRGIHLRESNGALISANTIATNTTDDRNWSYLTIAFGLITDRSSNLTISDNVISTRMRGGNGVYLRYGGDNVVSGNAVTTHGTSAHAISSVRSSSNIVSGNVLTATNVGSSYGVYLGILSHNGVVENNVVTAASGTGVLVNTSSGVVVRDNRLVGRGNSGVFTTEFDTVITGNTP